METAHETAQWYGDYYRTKGADRNDVFENLGVLSQQLAADGAMLAALRSIPGIRSARILDVGCGHGSTLGMLLRFNTPPDHLVGIDIQPDRITEATRRFPSIRFETADATALPYATGIFDVTLESTMFMQLTDDALAARIAGEMMRVTRQGGWLVLADWRYDGGRAEMRALTRSRIRTLFPGQPVMQTVRGALVPPVGRALSRYAPWAYDLVRAICPPLVGEIVTVLRRTGAHGDTNVR